MLSRTLLESRLLPCTGQLTQKCYVHHHKERQNLERFIGLKRSNPAKANRNTHMNEKVFRRARAAKTMIIDLPDDVEIREQEKMSPNELRIHFLKKGINPFKDVSPRTWEEHQTTLQSFYGVLDPFVKSKYVEKNDPNPPANQKTMTEKGREQLSHLWHTFQAKRRIKKKEGLEKFTTEALIPELEKIFEDAHRAITERDKNSLHKYITEHAFAKVWPDVETGSVFFELVKFNEPTEIVSIRASDNPSKSGNDIAQVIARMNTTQKLAVYDRFGKLMLGSPTEERSVIEFVVFENHIASFDGRWRLHDKVYPPGTAPKQGPLDKKLVESLTEDEVERPKAAKQLNLRIDERIKEELKNKDVD